MIILTKNTFKKLEYVAAYTSENEKGKTFEVDEHYDLVVDDEKLETRTLKIEASNEVAIEKLKRLKTYTEIYVIAEVSFYQNRVSKIVVRDILDEWDEIETVEKIVKKVVER